MAPMASLHAMTGRRVKEKTSLPNEWNPHTMFPTKDQVREWRSRWTEEKVREVKKAFREGKPLPVEKIPHAGKTLLTLPDNPVERSPQLTYDLRGIPLQGFYLVGVDLSYAHLEGAILTRAHLKGANIQGVHLEGAELVDTHLERANLHGANLRGADLRGARLSLSDLREAHLKEANLAHSNLQGADLRESHLDGAVLAGANLRGASLSRAHLKNGYLENARFDRTFIQNTRLEEAEDYRSIRWEGSHRIGEERKGNLVIALDLYRYLKEIYKGTRHYHSFHYRENVIKTKQKPWFHPYSFFRRLFLQWTYGYGSKLLRPFRAAVLVIILFTILSFLLTTENPQSFSIFLDRPLEKDGVNLISSHLPPFQQILHCFLFSLQSFSKSGTSFLNEKNPVFQIIHWKGTHYKPSGLAEVLSIFVGLIGIYLAFLFLYGLIRRIFLFIFLRPS